VRRHGDHNPPGTVNPAPCPGGGAVDRDRTRRYPGELGARRSFSRKRRLCTSTSADAAPLPGRRRRGRKRLHDGATTTNSVAGLAWYTTTRTRVRGLFRNTGSGLEARLDQGGQPPCGPEQEKRLSGNPPHRQYERWERDQHVHQLEQHHLYPLPARRGWPCGEARPRERSGKPHRSRLLAGRYADQRALHRHRSSAWWERRLPGRPIYDATQARSGDPCSSSEHHTSERGRSFGHSDREHDESYTLKPAHRRSGRYIQLGAPLELCPGASVDRAPPSADSVPTETSLVSHTVTTYPQRHYTKVC